AVRTWLLAPEAEQAGNTERLAQEITRSVLHLRAEGSLGDPRLLLLAGETTVRFCDAVLLASRLDVPVRALDLTAGLEDSGAVKSSRVDEAATFSDLAGAAAVRLLKGQATMNLLPPGLRTSQRRRGRKPWLVAAASLLLAAPVVPWLHFRATARAAESRAAEIERVIAPWRAQSAENRKRLDELELINRQVADWQNLHARRSSWLRMFADWQVRLRALDGVWIDRLQVFPAGPESPTRLSIAGRMLASPDEGSAGEAGWSERANGLLRTLEASPFVSRITTERFDASHPGWLGFELMLEPGEEEPL
ncbi:MAG: type pilus assembly protein PilM, partial [Verrucomicrobiota bacterium]|nr:type pilus assembly protein PilM [Verrucomicrobiota bacterium]